MKLSEFKKVVADIPAIYDDYRIGTCPCDGNYDIEDFVINDNNRLITFEP